MRRMHLLGISCSIDDQDSQGCRKSGGEYSFRWVGDTRAYEAGVERKPDNVRCQKQNEPNQRSDIDYSPLLGISIGKRFPERRHAYPEPRGLETHMADCTVSTPHPRRT